MCLSVHSFTPARSCMLPVNDESGGVSSLHVNHKRQTSQLNELSNPKTTSGVILSAQLVDWKGSYKFV